MRRPRCALPWSSLLKSRVFSFRFIRFYFKSFQRIFCSQRHDCKPFPSLRVLPALPTPGPRCCCLPGLVLIKSQIVYFILQEYSTVSVLVDGEPFLLSPRVWGLQRVLRKEGGYETASIGAYRQKDNEYEYRWIYLTRMALPGVSSQ